MLAPNQEPPGPPPRGTSTEFGPKEGIDIYALLCTKHITNKNLASQVALVVNNLPTSAGDLRDSGLTPGSGRSPGGGHGNPLQYCCLENPMDSGAWPVTYSPWGRTESDLTEST